MERREPFCSTTLGTSWEAFADCFFTKVSTSTTSSVITSSTAETSDRPHDDLKTGLPARPLSTSSCTGGVRWVWSTGWGKYCHKNFVPVFTERSSPDLAYYNLPFKSTTCRGGREGGREGERKDGGREQQSPLLSVTSSQFLLSPPRTGGMGILSGQARKCKQAGWGSLAIADMWPTTAG